MLDPVNDSQLEVYEGLLKVDGDPREGQVFLNFDRVYTALEYNADFYQLEKPLLFEKTEKDRTALTLFNRREVRVPVCSVSIVAQP